MTNHTPEPWMHAIDVYDAAFLNEEPHRIEEVWEINVRDAGETAAYATSYDNMERIVACVNACAGMKLEDVARIPAMLSNYSRLVRKAAHGCVGANCRVCDHD